MTIFQGRKDSRGKYLDFRKSPSSCVARSPCSAVSWPRKLAPLALRLFYCETRIDGSVLAVLAAYQNNLVTSKRMTSQVVQWFPTLT